MPTTLQSNLTPAQSRALWDAIERVCILVGTGWSAMDVREAWPAGAGRHAELARKMSVRAPEFDSAFRTGAGNGLFDTLQAELLARLPSHPVLGSLPDLPGVLRQHASTVRSLAQRQDARRRDLAEIAKPLAEYQETLAKYNTWISEKEDYLSKYSHGRVSAMNDLDRLRRNITDVWKGLSDRQAAERAVHEKPHYVLCGFCGRDRGAAGQCRFAGGAPWLFTVYK